MASERITLTVPGPDGDREVGVSNPNRVIWPELGITKQELAEYLLAVQEPFLASNGDRPVSLERFPDGVEGERFYSKNPPKGAPAFVEARTVTYNSGRRHPQIILTEIAAAVWAVQMNTIVFHPWASLTANTDNPVELRIDLDPQPGTDFADAAAVAPALRDVLAEAGLTAFLKTSGNRGIHVFCAHRAGVRVPRRASRRDRRRARAGAAPARQGHHELVEGGARRAHLHRLQPGQPRPHDGRRLQSARAGARRPCRRRSDVGRARGRRPRRPSPCAPCRSASQTWAIPGPTCWRTPARIDTLLEWWHRDLDGGLGELPFPPDFPKMPGEPPRVQPSRINPENWPKNEG